MDLSCAEVAGYLFSFEDKDNTRRYSTSPNDQKITQLTCPSGQKAEKAVHAVSKDQIIDHVQRHCPKHGVFYRDITQYKSNHKRKGRLNDITMENSKQDCRCKYCKFLSVGL